MASKSPNTLCSVLSLLQLCSCPEQNPRDRLTAWLLGETEKRAGSSGYRAQAGAGSGSADWSHCFGHGETPSSEVSPASNPGGSKDTLLRAHITLELLSLWHSPPAGKVQGWAK